MQMLDRYWSIGCTSFDCSHICWTVDCVCLYFMYFRQFSMDDIFCCEIQSTFLIKIKWLLIKKNCFVDCLFLSMFKLYAFLTIYFWLKEKTRKNYWHKFHLNQKSRAHTADSMTIFFVLFQTFVFSVFHILSSLYSLQAHITP